MHHRVDFDFIKASLFTCVLIFRMHYKLLSFLLSLTCYFPLLCILQAFPGHKGPVSCLTFRQGSSELFSGSFDRSIKIWNVEDRAYMSTLFGHQSEVLAIDCLWQERVLAVGRDRSMQLFKVYKIMFRYSLGPYERRHYWSHKLKFISEN